MITVKIDIGKLGNIREVVKSLSLGGQLYDNVVRTTATSMLGVIKNRIHEEGKAADGSDIGRYDTTNPLYVNPKNSPKSFPVEGKTGKTKFETGIKKGQAHKTRYFNSYSDFRQTIGRRTDKVDLSLSGQLNSQFVVIATENGYGLGWNNQEMPDRARGLESKYAKKIWGLTEGEKELAVKIAQKEINDAIS